MLEIVLVYLAASLILYAVFGGADFGAGILEIIKPAGRALDQEKLIGKAMGPVWEANHVWLIVVVVILFSGFPEAFHSLSITLHVPLTLLLIGITLRGCAFTFRHYDAYPEDDQRSRRLYSLFFEAASLLTPMMLGLIAASLMLGRMPSPAQVLSPASTPVGTPAPTSVWTWYDHFMAPWLSVFGFSVGLFVVALFAFVAAVFLAGETTDLLLRAHYRRRALHANIAAVAIGALVFGAAHTSGLDLAGRFFSHPLAILAMGVATILLPVLHKILQADRPRILMTRILASSIFGCVLVGWFALQFPIIIASADGGMTLYETAAPEPTLQALAMALMAGSVLMFPALGYLFWVFKRGASK